MKKIMKLTQSAISQNKLATLYIRFESMSKVKEVMMVNMFKKRHILRFFLLFFQVHPDVSLT